ncbi:hypothetical protein PG993_009083 [Apiospora rasikravindrae]|uniref:Uncharacterized protein n=1 Tax=Apiospora rasikravindrae TaxID=990691 RepID=A0ABR1SIG7_9PEZI
MAQSVESRDEYRQEEGQEGYGTNRGGYVSPAPHLQRSRTEAFKIWPRWRQQTRRGCLPFSAC